MKKKGTDKKPSIEPTKDGPYSVKDLENFENSKGQKIQTRPSMLLCRCGGSKNKPFCDGTHATTGFSGKKLNDGRNDKRDNYEGKKITIHDNRSICAHSGFCTDGSPKVFKLGKEPWIYPNAEEAESIIKTIKKCPSGALSYSIDNTEHRDQDRKPMIYVSKDGPYYITGYIEIKNEPRAEGTSEEHYTLCRCGGSKNKPFCDATHWTIKFTDEKN